MPLPTHNDLHVVDQVLTDYSIGYGQDIVDNFISFRATTNWDVADQSDRYVTWNKGDWFRAEMEKRADGTRSQRGGFRMSSDTYYADVYGLNSPVTKRQRKRASLRGIDIEKVKVRWLTEQAHLRRDIVTAASIFATGLWTSNTEQTGVASGVGVNEFLQWNDSSSTPIVDIQEQMEVIRTSIGRKPNVAVTSPGVINALRQHADLTDLFKYTTGGLPDEAKLAETFGLERIVVGKAIQNTANEGATASMADIFGKHFLLMYIDPEPSEERPTAATSFSWSEFDGMSPEGAAITTWYEDAVQSDIYEAETAFAVKITANDAGVMMLSAIA